MDRNLVIIFALFALFFVVAFIGLSIWGGQRNPIIVNVKDENNAGIETAKVELYNTSNEYSKYPTRTLMKTLYTDANGVVDFGIMEIDYGYLVVSKDGYYNAIQSYDRKSNPNLLIRMFKIKPIIITVKDDNSRVVSEAKVELYNISVSNVLTLVKTLYTDANGVADFGKMEIDCGYLVVTKEGYKNQTRNFYPSLEGTNNIRIYLNQLEG